MSSVLVLTASLVVASAVLLLLCTLHDYRKRKGLPYPPGPTPLPVIGNLLDIPTVESWVTYTEWEKKYGEIMSMQVLGNFIVVLQSYKAMKDLLERRGQIYSDRPVSPFFDMMELHWAIPIARYAEQWRSGRRALDRSLRQSAAVLYRPIQKAKAHAFLKNLLARPEDFREHLEHFQGAMLMAITYGYDVEERHDVHLGKARELSDLAASTVLPGALLVNDLPFLRHLPEWLPGMDFKSLARHGRVLAEEVVNGPFNFVKEAMEKGTARPSLARESLRESQDGSQMAERDIATALGSLYAGGSDTTVSALSSFFLMLVLYPSVQKKAQAELDAVTGGARLPDFDDRANLPYVDALCKELLRWRMVTPLGLPHATTEDDVYNGLFIPKGAIVLANSWAILHDSSLYPEPETFKPERFITADGRVKDDHLLNVAFGFGKRLCPGRHIVDSTLFIVVSFILATFSVSKAKDDYGYEIPVEDEYTGMQLSQPVPFKCSIVPRTEATKGLITDVIATE
ncbi:cytochrome P450 [Artomyces pyxidatus]|uniref:Cytochrome P450 n=1 Tax=Artomyces pyxidatus TaxID=48021 RepID=A0ACB8TA10_9AGAM|nr:cytochrome P450 [Artomyces pyxidatus]